jgi:hypothetical protein
VDDLLIDEAEARRKHQPRHQGVRGAEPAAGGVQGEEEDLCGAYNRRILPRRGRKKHPSVSVRAQA